MVWAALAAALFLFGLALTGCGFAERVTRPLAEDSRQAAELALNKIEAQFAARPPSTPEEVRAIVSDALTDFGVQLGHAIEARRDEGMGAAGGAAAGGVGGVLLAAAIGFLRRLIGVRAAA